MAKHAYSFRDLLSLRYDVTSELRALKNLKKSMTEFGCSVPPAINTRIVVLGNRYLELQSIRKDRFEASERRQAIIGCGVEF